MRTLARSGRAQRLATAAMAGLFVTVQMPAAAAQDGWNPFAEKDRQAARSAARQRRQQKPKAVDNRPYLAPITPDGSAPSQPYPATSPGYGASNTYQPPGTSPAAVPGSVPYGAPGTYIPASPSGTPNFAAHAPGVQRGELTPVISGDGALPKGTWQHLDASGAEQLLGSTQLPPASAALNDLFNRIMAEPVSDPRLNAVRIAALLRAGRFQQAARLRKASPRDQSSTPVQDITEAKLDLATGATEAGCRRIKAAVATPAKLAKQVRGEAVVLAGYCAIIAGNRQAGGLAAELARDSGYNQPFVLGLLEAIASGDAVRAPLPQAVSMLDGLLVQQLKKPDPALIDGMLKRADAGFLQLVASATGVAPGLRLKAAERGAAANILSPAALAEAYRATAQAPSNPAGAPQERARQFVAAEQSQAQFAKTRAVRALLDSARRDGLYQVTAVAAAPIVRAMRPAQEISWFTETAIEILAAAADYETARQWVRASGAGDRRGSAGTLDHWLMLLDIADPKVSRQNRGRRINLLENLALQGRFTPAALHRLATVLDALDYNIPVPLWNLASRTEQPQTGHLPETGMLSAMKQASEGRQIAATTLYALRTIAPSGTPATHLLGLGETIRALKRAGLEKAARRIGFEALFSSWPRSRR